MAKYLVKNSGPLKGEVTISGAKNSVLPIMAATLLADEECLIYDAPDLRDVDVMCKIMEGVGVKVNGDLANNVLSLNSENITANEAPAELVKRMRASILTMGPLLARIGSARVALPGGCAIGARPIDLHLKGFEKMGADIKFGTNYVEAKADKLKGAKIYLDYPSVGATENLVIAASLANYLNKMGARIKGAGTDTIKIEGVERLHGTKHCVIPDRIETGTFMVAAAITHGNILIKNVVPDHVRPIIAKLQECGVTVEDTLDGLRVDAENCELVATDIKTLPYPGFPTDMQSQFMALLTTVKGGSTVIETVFENRYMHINELNRMGAGITIEGRRAVIPGGRKLKGAPVISTDLRAGAAMVLAGLAAEGVTEISEIYHIERGYTGFVEKLRGLGADITRVEE